MSPEMALYVAMNFSLMKNADTVAGPYEPVYPWSPLEETSYEAVGRFCLAKPKDLLCGAPPAQDNVHSLWQQTDEQTLDLAAKTFAAFEQAEDLRLPQIVTGLTNCINQQAKVI
jgi:hypothetical protein